MKATIAIIGATGSVGSAMARRLAKAGFPLILMSSEEAELQNLQEEISRINSRIYTEVITCEKEAAWEADIIIPSIARCDQGTVAGKIKQVSIGKIVMCLSSKPAAEELQQLLPHSKVVFVQGAIPAAGDGIAACEVSGKDACSVEAAAKVLREAGFAVVNDSIIQ